MSAPPPSPPPSPSRATPSATFLGTPRPPFVLRDDEELLYQRLEPPPTPLAAGRGARAMVTSLTSLRAVLRRLMGRGPDPARPIVPPPATRLPPLRPGYAITGQRVVRFLAPGLDEVWPCELRAHARLTMELALADVAVIEVGPAGGGPHDVVCTGRAPRRASGQASGQASRGADGAPLVVRLVAAAEVPHLVSRLREAWDRARPGPGLAASAASPIAASPIAASPIAPAAPAPELEAATRGPGRPRMPDVPGVPIVPEPVATAPARPAASAA